jgi:hypothetical protein
MQPLTPYERQAVAKTFKKAKALFEQGHCTYICTALYWTLPHTYQEDSEEYRAYKLAKAIVMERLEGQNSLECWLKKQGFFFPTDPTPELKQKLRNHRLQWLDLLIAEFEGEKS